MELPELLDYLIRRPVGGALTGTQSVVNSAGYLSQRMAPDKEVEDAVWMDFQNGNRDSDAWLASLSEEERRAMEASGQDPYTLYRLHLQQEARDRHREDTPVQIADWGDRYRAVTERRYGDVPGLIRFLGDVGESIGAVAPAMALHAVPVAGPLLSGGYIFSSAAGAAEEKALREGATLNEAVTYGVLKGTTALLTEYAFDGLSGLLGKGATDKLIGKVVDRLSKTPEGRRAINAVIRAGGEGSENLLEDLLDPFFATVYTHEQYSRLEDIFTAERVGDMLYDFLLGAAVGGVFESTRTRRYDRGDVAEAVVVDDALEAFRATDSADAIRALAQESSGDGTNGLSDHAGHGIIQYNRSALTALEGTEHFLPSAIEHIFEGSRGGGYHYEGIENARGSVIPGTQSAPNAYGVYDAEVMIDGVRKRGAGKSTFFPADMSPQQVIDAVNQAYANREHTKGNRYEGTSENGIPIGMFLDSEGRIISAFPLY